MNGNLGTAWAAIALAEGGSTLSDRSAAADPGGTTRWGISLRFADAIGLDLDGDGVTTRADILLVTERVAMDLFERHFWGPVRGDDLPAGVDLIAADMAFLQGVPATRRLLQQAAGVAVDGIIGPRTLAAIQAANAADLIEEVTARRIQYLASLSNWQHNAGGWTRRALRIMRAGMVLAAEK
jgi:lysozyme family protein